MLEKDERSFARHLIGIDIYPEETLKEMRCKINGSWIKMDKSAHCHDDLREIEGT